MTRKLPTLSRPHNRRGAFTMFEMLIVIALIALIAGLAIAKLGGLFDDAQKKIAEQFVNTSLKVPLTAYKIDMGSYPTTAQGLQALVTSPDTSSGRWKGPYLETKGNQVPEDPWKHTYQYRFPGTKNSTGYDVYSFGPDGVESDDDIGNW